jgi:hypothetical protein
MERLLRITNVLLGIIALCLVLLVASIYRVDLTPKAYAAGSRAQAVYLVYSDDMGHQQVVVDSDGHVPTKP